MYCTYKLWHVQSTPVLFDTQWVTAGPVAYMLTDVRGAKCECICGGHTSENMFLVSWRVATLSQSKRCMRANRALFACTSEGMVLKNLGNMALSERVGVLAPYDTCACATQKNRI